MSEQLEREIVKILKQCRELLWLCFAGILIMVLILFYADMVKAEEWDRDDYYRENVHSEYYDYYYAEHYGYVDDCCPDEDERRMERNEEKRERWYREDYKDYLRDQGVEEGMLQGW